MEEIKLVLNERNRGAFLAMEDGEQLGEMVVGILGSDLTVYHTEVSDKAEGKGLAKKMLIAMVEHARKNHLKVIPLCTFVHTQFRRRPADYADIWAGDVEHK
jgi:predicted GNAT family acetyltransferase